MWPARLFALLCALGAASPWKLQNESGGRVAVCAGIAVSRLVANGCEMYPRRRVTISFEHQKTFPLSRPRTTSVALLDLDR